MGLGLGLGFDLTFVRFNDTVFVMGISLILGCSTLVSKETGVASMAP
ncbi:hypothetical protein AM1_0167 [Acaryochloris marina MBIC11017]|uniref:Uncharacterized protein n=1 Tax=Acaryochloris marina (strain MBIC 11017) TaxID=329726 RepID=B0C7J3_ACAM1|nr:hypothetical protein AM1_0167 [Acaryochloris marina MBIC11017]